MYTHMHMNTLHAQAAHTHIRAEARVRACVHAHSHKHSRYTYTQIYMHTQEQATYQSLEIAQIRFICFHSRQQPKPVIQDRRILMVVVQVWLATSPHSWREYRAPVPFAAKTQRKRQRLNFKDSVLCQLQEDVAGPQASMIIAVAVARIESQFQFHPSRPTLACQRQQVVFGVQPA